MYTVDKGIPVPPHCPARGIKKYPFDIMEVGDSFGIASKEEAALVRGAAHHQQVSRGIKLSIQKHGTGWRCWRIA